MGLFAAVIFYPVISTTKRHKMITWACRIAAIPLPVILFVVLTRNFYTGNPYSGTSILLISGIFYVLTSIPQPVLGADTCRVSRLVQIISELIY